MAATLRGLWQAYERQLSARPIPTQMLTSCVLWCAGDYMAQSIEHYEATHYGPNRSSSSSSSDNSSSSNISSKGGAYLADQHAAQQHDQNAAWQLLQEQQQQQQKQLATVHQQRTAGNSSSGSGSSISSSEFQLDTRRLMLTSAFGAGFIGPVGHLWYEGIEKVCRKLVPTGGARFLATKVVLDSAIMGSVYVIAFFAFIATALEGTGLQGFKQKMEVDFVPTYIAELAFWPLVQTLNFSQVPVRHQLLVVNTFSLLDAAFISWVGNQEGWYTKILDRMGLSGSTIGSNKEQ